MLRTNPFQKASELTQKPQKATTTPFSSSKSTTHQDHTPNSPISTLGHYYNGQIDTHMLSKSDKQLTDQFNCSEQYINPTCSTFPNTPHLLSELSVPLGLTISPMSPSIPSSEIPIIDYGENPIPRCSNTQCYAYLNPFVHFINNGENWECNICKHINKTEEYYFSPINGNGIRTDLKTKKELYNGSYEFITNKKYWINEKNPAKATFIFVIDVSYNSIKNGFLTAVIESIKDSISNLLFNNGEDIRIAFLVYDSTVSFFSFDKRASQPQLLSIYGNDVFCPTIIDNILLSLKDNKDKLLSIADAIQSGYTHSNDKDSNNIFIAIKAAHCLIKEQSGKIIVFSGSNNLNKNPMINSKEIKTNSQEEQYYSCLDNKQIAQLGLELTNEYISVDVFATSEDFMNVLTLNQICDFTNGSIYFYRNFNIEVNYKSIFNQIRRVLSRETAFEAKLLTRISHEYKIGHYLTPVLLYKKKIIVCPTYDSDQHITMSIVFKSENDGFNRSKAKEDENFVYIQSEMIYSYGDGTRRIRIHNKAIPLSSRAMDIYKSINAESLSCFYMKKTIDTIYQCKSISNSIIKTETKFSSLISSLFKFKNSMKNELPENLCFLPLYILGMIKHRVFCKDEIERKFDIDISNYLRIRILRLSIDEIHYFIYPCIYPLHILLDDDKLGTYDENEGMLLPGVISAHIESFEYDGLYLIDNGYLLILYIKKGINKVLIKSLFNSDTLESISFPLTEEKIFEHSEDNTLKERIINIIDYIRGNKSLFQSLIFVLEDTDAERM